ncbi:MAG: glycosyltransferase family 2 protein [Oscillospiraceae bacterium]|jgi:dolichol-phosphate mannosyltransferase|nr:glycosyltransferase family 2 protein [Oscillospiraceae bacterium]
MALISIILPAYNEEQSVSLALRRLRGVLGGIDGFTYELVFVDDGSRDGTWQAIRDAGLEDARVRGVSFSRNFGKEAAILAGLDAARGDCCVVMDCDMQHPPEIIPEMLKLWRQGYQVVEGKKAHRGRENPFYKCFTKLFYALMSAATHIDMANTSDFKLLDREVVKTLLEMPERHMFFRAISAWVGYRTVSVPFYVEPRQAGTGKFRAKGLIRYALGNLASFSTAPMQLITFLGIITFIIALAFGINTLYNYLSGNALGGFTTVILLMLFFFSIVMISLGIIGYYIARIFEAVKGRPRYIVNKTSNLTEEAR